MLLQGPASTVAPADSQMTQCLNTTQIKAAEDRLLQLSYQENLLAECAEELRRATSAPNTSICKLGQRMVLNRLTMPVASYEQTNPEQTPKSRFCSSNTFSNDDRCLYSPHDTDNNPAVQLVQLSAEFDTTFSPEPDARSLERYSTAQKSDQSHRTVRD